MHHSREAVSLPEQDYNAILDVITGLLSHKTTGSLTGLFRSHVLPLLDASTCFYAWSDSNFLDPQVIDVVGIPEAEFDTFRNYFSWSPLAQRLASGSGPVEPFELEVPRSEFQDSISKFFDAHPNPQKRGSSCLDELGATLHAIDLSEPAVVIGFHRLNACRQSFTRREKRILGLLRPHLCQAVRNLVLKEKLGERVSTTREDPMDSQTPTVQVTRDSRIVDQNHEFQTLFHSLPGDNLSTSLTRFLESGVRSCEKSLDARIPEPEALLVCLCPKVYKVDVFRRSDDLWILELHRLSGVCPGFNSNLRDYGLTPKEKEICCRVRQGFDNREVASQLCISYHTAKTHLKNVYRKLDIPNRPRLVSFLNQN